MKLKYTVIYRTKGMQTFLEIEKYFMIIGKYTSDIKIIILRHFIASQNSATGK